MSFPSHERGHDHGSDYVHGARPRAVARFGTHCHAVFVEVRVVFRRIAMRFEKLARNFLAFLFLASSLVWLR